MFKKIILFLTILNSIAAIDNIPPGYCLFKSSSIYSDNGCFRLTMQDDGNLVIYRISDNKPLWSSQTSQTESCVACVQKDGNFVIYTNEEKPTWSTGTHDNTLSHLILQNNGNLVLYNEFNYPKWQSNTISQCKNQDNYFSAQIAKTNQQSPKQQSMKQSY
ncbi:hypothetical protein PVAND_005316 [Polypedilum vanderplanki]|uniref:Bulb-type lectin domain-containing protein n=1 Tax=Polypedilum vanderplanki TaxID=319348 RepID=A0A9J6C0G9_POLVA|nr:hypothetical protein PVAND_005316 [Polypedilum vanderplanki]